MKKIIITEAQLKKITELLVVEQEHKEKYEKEKKPISIEGRFATINTDGTMSINNKSKIPVKIRFKTANLGNVNIVKFNKINNENYQIITLKGLNKDFPIDKVYALLNFVDDSSKTESGTFDKSLVTGALYAVKI